MNNSNEMLLVEEPTDCFLFEYMRVARDGLNVRRKAGRKLTKTTTCTTETEMTDKSKFFFFNFLGSSQDDCHQNSY